MYCYLIRYKSKQKQLLPFLVTNDKCIINVDSNDELKEVDIKTRPCRYFDDISEIEDFNLDNILKDENHTKMF